MAVNVVVFHLSLLLAALLFPSFTVGSECYGPEKDVAAGVQPDKTKPSACIFELKRPPPAESLWKACFSFMAEQVLLDNGTFTPAANQSVEFGCGDVRKTVELYAEELPSWCVTPAKGDECQRNQSFGAAIGQLCCCQTDRCNDAFVSRFTTTEAPGGTGATTTAHHHEEHNSAVAALVNYVLLIVVIVGVYAHRSAS